MYVLLTTYPEHGSGNVGDILIADSATKLVQAAKGDVPIRVFFRGDPLDEHLEELNSARAVLMPGFAIRDPLYPQIYALTKHLSDITVPLIPIGTGWASVPGDLQDRKTTRYSEATLSTLRYVASQIGRFACREHFTEHVLNTHGISNTIVTGDCAWYDLASLGKPMRRPEAVTRLVFTPPVMPLFREQGLHLMRSLADRFPDAERLCSFHGTPRQREQPFIKAAAELDYEVRNCSHDLAAIDFYETCDLHVGYRVHGHLAFLRKRIPSLLMAEDGRGLGVGYTLGPFIVPAAVRVPATVHSEDEGSNQTLQTPHGGKEPPLSTTPNPQAVETAMRFLQEEVSSRFRRFIGVADMIDRTYEEVMQPFIRSLP